MDAPRKLKVLQLLEWFELGGGLETITGEIALGLDKDLFDVEIWCVARGGKLVGSYRNKGVTVRVLGIHTYYNPFNVLKLVNLFKASRPDIVHSHVYFASTIGRVAARIAGVPVCISHVHSTYWHYSKINLLIERFLSGWTDTIICVSNVVRDFVIRHEQIDEKRTVVIPNGITRQDDFSGPSIRVTCDVKKDEVLIVCVASLLENKGHKVLFEAMEILKRSSLKVKCLIVGEGPMETELKKMTAELKLDGHIRFLGVRNDVPVILKECDVFVLPSIHREGLPVSILEAMAYGVSVVASAVGGVPEVINDNSNGLLVHPGDAQQLAQNISKLIFDPELRRRLADQARVDFSEKFQAKVMIRRIQQVYQECARNHGIQI